MKRGWLYVTLLAGALALAVTGGTVLAHGGEADGESPAGGMVSRVAAILGLGETDVQGAFDQAKEEIRDEAVQNRLDRLVENGLLTPEESEEYLGWFEARPETLAPRMYRGFGDGGLHHGTMGGHGMMRGGMGFWMGGGHHTGDCDEAPAASPTPENPDATSL